MSKHVYPRSPLWPLAFAVVLSACCANSQPASAQGTQAENKPADGVHGIVVNSVTHEPIGRALVYSPDNRFAIMTDSEGRFEFTLAQDESNPKKDQSPPASASGSTMTTCNGRACTTYTSSNGGAYQLHTLTARKPGFLDDQNEGRNLPSDTGKDFTIALTPEALIVGRVVLASSEASDKIQLELYRREVQEGRAHWILVGSTSTKSNGEFRFAELAAGKYKLLTRELLDRDPLIFDPRGQLYGYPPVYFPAASDFAGGETIQLAAGQIFQADISLVRRAYYQIKVPVANPSPGPGVRVVVSVQGHRGPGYALGYNHREQTIEGMLPSGNYTLEASSFGPNSASGVLNISVKNAAFEGSRMTLLPNGSISVNVKEEFTSPEDANVTRTYRVNGELRENLQGPRNYLPTLRLQPADDFGQEWTASLRLPAGVDDALTIDGVQPGRYWVRADSARGFVASMTSGTTDLQHQLLVVGLGGSSPPIEITMRDGAAEIDGTIDGVAASGSGTETASAHVYCIPLPDSSGEFKDVWVQPDGKFGPQQLPPGTYRVLAFDRPQPELEYRNPEAMRAYDAKGQLVRLVPSQKEHLHLQVISTSE